MPTLEQQALSKTWFYPFRLPGGAVTPTYDGGALDAIHATRLAMLQAAVRATFGESIADRSVIDIACHQGWFSTKLAEMGAEKAMAADKHLAAGLNVSGGKIRHAAVAEALDLPFEAWAG